MNGSARSALFRKMLRRGNTMAWTTPTLVEICIGLEINGYLPAEF
jgi:coenzyme PQQ precursor peptide PqqA